MAHPNTTPRTARLEEAVTVLFCLVDDAYRILNPGADGYASLKPNSKKRSWSKRLRRWVAGIPQIVETVYDKLFNTFGLWRERPHEIQGLRARLATRVALHNFRIWLNDQFGRPRLKVADLIGW